MTRFTIGVLVAVIAFAATQDEQLERAEKLIEIGDVKSADTLLAQLKAAGPDSAALHVSLGDLAWRRGDFAGAERQFKQAIQIDGKFAWGWYGLGRVFELSSYHKSAAAYFERAHRLAPDDPQISLMWSRQLKGKERIAALEQYLAQSDETDPERKQRVEHSLEVAKQTEGLKRGLAGEYQPATIPLGLLMVDGKRYRGYSLSVSMNDGKPVRLLLDTGAGGILIKPGAAERFGLRKLTQTQYYGLGDGGVQNGYTALAEKVRIGPVEFRNMVVDVSEKKGVADEDGLIGTDVFAQFLVTLDFYQKQVHLEPLPKREDGLTDRVFGPEQKSWTPVFRQGHTLLVPTKVSDSPTKLFILDTGASSTLIDRALAAEQSKVHNEDRVHMKGVSGKIKDVYSANDLWLQFAGYRQRNLDILAIDMSGQSNRQGMEISGLLGLPLLNLFRTVQIDYRDGLVRFEYKE